MRRSLPILWAAALSFAGCSEPGQTEIARGNVLASRKKLDEAAAQYRAAARAVPGKARPLELLGHVLFDQQKLAEARAAYQAGLAAEPAAALEAQIGLARLDADQGQLQGALDRLGSVLERHPENLYARLSRANLTMRRGAEGDAKQALADTASAMAVEPKNPTVLYTRGCAHIAARELEAARQVFGQLDRASPSSPLAPYGLARVAGARADRAEVIYHLRQARSRAEASQGAWKPAEVQADPAFSFLKEDPDFLKVLSDPKPSPSP